MTHQEQWYKIDQEVRSMTEDDYTFEQMARGMQEGEVELEQLNIRQGLKDWAGEELMKEGEVWAEVMAAITTPMNLYHYLCEFTVCGINKQEAAYLWVWLYHQEP